ncbi:extracellular solute-binding protein [Mesorhizobium sp. B2-4-15]|uniref:extracellular solute-binding protein n=1 Tax=Mesorhizobium sp. B2-4-15 TaxID=2589934 RepID=UPI00114EE54E|nr:extracellular solute-binding protein [Mesorhizobium sp. B2-4-15]TPK73593.1 extracellular solute-binding protein [Mesorhizobium sp. B2-4-15]
MGRMRKLLTGLAVLAGLGTSTGLAQSETLRIVTWQGYADDDWVEEFEAAYNADVQVTFVGDDAEIWAKVRGSNGADADIITTNTGQLQRYIDANLLAPIDLNMVPNQKEVLEQFRDLAKIPGVMRNGKVFMMPYVYAPYLLAYNPDLVSEAPTSWSSLWDPKYKGKVLTHDSYEYNFTIAAILDGAKDPFQLSEDELQRCKTKLIDLQHQLLSYYQYPEEVVQLWQSNEIAVMMAAYGPSQINALRKAGAKVEAVIPKEGTPTWLDSMAVTVGAKGAKYDLAMKWINFALKKEISKALARRTNFGTTGFDTGAITPNDKIFWVQSIEDPTRRSDLWNEIKATP